MPVIAILFVGLFLVVSPGLSFPEKDVPNAEPEYLDMLLETKQYELFSKLMGIGDVDLVRPSEKERSADPMFNKGLEFGDILPLRNQMEEARQGIRFERYGGSRWPGSVPYVISNDYTSSQRRTIQNGINRWNQLVGCVKFNPRRGEEDYVMFFSGNGCYSNLGRVGNQQPISLQSNGCLSQGTILHEMEHAIGIAHEHNREDRDSYISMIWENIPERWKSQYQKVNPRDFRNLGGYDYYSVMHYRIPAPETNKPAFEVIRSGVDESKIGRGNDFTRADLDKISELYC